MAVNFNKLKQEILEEHNKVRSNPASYIPKIEKILTYFKGDVIYKPGEIGVQTDEGKAVYKEAIEFLKKQKAIGTLVLNENLSRAAQDHCNDIGPKGLTDHDGSNGSTVTDRIEKYLEWDKTVAENLDFGGKTGEDVLISLIVDDGNPGRGHRKTIFNKDLFIIGIGIGKHSEYEICTTLDYVGAIKNEKTKGKSQDLGGLEAPKQAAAPQKPNVSIKTEKVDPKKKNQSNQDQVNSNAPVGDFLFGPKADPLIGDEDKPDDAVDVSIKTVIKKVGDRKLVKITKTYTLKDGSEEIVEIEERHEA